MLLAGSTKPNRSAWSRDQTKPSTLALQVGGWAGGQLPPPANKELVTETMDFNDFNVKNRTGEAGTAGSGSMTTMMGRSLREAKRPTRPFVTPKQTSTIRHWNVQNMYRGRAAEQITREMEKYQLDTLGISECRWTGARKRMFATGQTVTSSGHSWNGPLSTRGLSWQDSPPGAGG